MAAGGSGSGSDDDDRREEASGADADLYAVLGLSKECTDAELRLAYRRLAMTWHPDRCASASGSSSTRVTVEEAKERFQEIQGAYSVLSDSNKRFLYDVGVYDSDDDEQDVSGMGDFLGEMAEMMSQATPTETFEELQQLFVDMFQADLVGGFCSGPHAGHPAHAQGPPCTSRSPAWSSSSSSSPWPPPLAGSANPQAPQSCKGSNKRRFSPATGSGMPPTAGHPGPPGLGMGLSGFCLKGGDWRSRRDAPWTTQDDGSGRKKQRISTTSRDVSWPEQRGTLCDHERASLDHAQFLI